MKKFASIAICFALMASMVLGAITSASAYTATDKKATLKINKITYVDGTSQTGNPVEGATFTIYQVLELGSDGLYYVTDDFANSGIEVSDLAITINGDDKSTENGYVTYGDTAALESQIVALQDYTESAKLSGTSKKTDSDGAALFSDCTYGVYLVVETGVPDGYTAASKSFLVAINDQSLVIDEETQKPATLSDGSNYVEATPKNAAIDADKKIVTSDENGTKTKTEADSYSIGDKITYELTSTVPIYDEEMLQGLQKAEYEYLNGTTGEVKKPDQLYCLIPYYFIDSMSEGLTLDLSSVKVTVGNTIFYSIDSSDESKSVKNASVYAKYFDSDGNEITSDISKYTDAYTTQLYVVIKWADLYSALDSNGDVVTDGDSYVNHMGEKVTVSYTATLNKYAVIYDSEDTNSKNGTTNKATLYYSNDPQTMDPSLYWKDGDEYDPKPDPENPDIPVPDPEPEPTEPDPDNPDNPTPDDDDTPTVKVYTYEMDLTKTFNSKKVEEMSDDEFNASVVTFTLERALLDSDGELQYEKDGTLKTEKVMVVYDKADGVYYAANSDQSESNKLTLGKTDGTLVLKGLAAGTYVLTETKTVDGYSLLTAPLIIVVEETTVDDDSDDSDDSTPQVLSGIVKAYYVNDGKKVDLNTNSDGTFELSVNNSKAQFNLPTTGGLGLWIFTVLGGVIMAGAIIFISVIRKKKKV